MTCALLSLAGAPATQTKPELFDIKTRTCHAEWDPSLMLALFKAVKDVVVSVVNMKYDIHKSLRSVWPTSGKRMWCCKRPNKPLARRELRSLLSGKGTFVEQFLLWFKTTRDPWLPQPFMLITLDARDTIVRGTIAPYHLCIELDAFTSTFLPHQWSFLGCRIRSFLATEINVQICGRHFAHCTFLRVINVLSFQVHGYAAVNSRGG